MPPSESIPAPAAIGHGKHVVVVGIGLAGALLATALARLGYRVSAFERRPDPRAKGYSGGRSINLALSIRGIEALKRLGLAEQVMHEAIPMRGRMIHSREGALAFQPYSTDPGDALNSVSRGGLNLALIHAAAAEPNVVLHFNHRCTDVDLETPAAIFEDESAPTDRRVSLRVPADLVIGTDGAFSAVRNRLAKVDRYDSSQSYLAHGYKELHIPPAAGGFALDPHALHIWPRGGSMMIALPNTDKSFTCTLFWPFEGEHSFADLRTREQVRAFFEREYPDAVPLMPTLEDDFLRHPASSLVTVRCWPWSYGGRVVLLGDAAHAIVPFFGQGMNCAFEDCSAFIDLVERHRGNFHALLPEFERLRKPNADAIADLALENFIEMRDKVASRAFLWKKKFEHALHRLFPRAFVPLYHMVSFTTIPYAAARARAERQWGVVRGVMVASGLVLALVIILAGMLARR